MKALKDPFFSEKEFLSEDRIFNYRYIKNSQKISIVNERFYNYVQHNEGTITTTFKEYKIEATYNMVKYLLDVEENIELRQFILIDYLVNLSACCQQIFMDNNLKNRNKINLVKKIVYEKKCISLISEINYKKLSIKFKVFNFLLIHHCKILIFIMFKINTKKIRS